MTTLRVGIDSTPAKKGGAEVVTATDKMRDSAGRFARVEGKQAQTRIKSIGTTAIGVRGVLSTMFGGLSAGLAVRSAVRTVASFEETLTTVRGVAGATQEQFVDLSDAARELGATTRFSATEAGEGLLFLSRAGFEVDEAIGALPGTLDTAVAGALSLGDAADIVSNVLSTFNLEAQEASVVGDILANTANSSNTNISQLAEAVREAGSVAATANIPLETLAAATGVLGDRGVQAGIAGRNLRGIILGLAAPTSDAEKAIDKLGLSFSDVSPATNDFIDILDTLGDAFAEVGQEETLALANSIFGRRNIGAAIALANATDSVRELAAANENAEGASKALADLLNNTLIGSFLSLKSAIEEAVLQLGLDDGGFAGILKTIVVGLTDGVRVLIGFEEHVATNAENAHAWATALQLVGVFLGSLVASKVVVVVFNMSKAFLAATAGTRAFTAALAANPIGFIAVAITLATAALIEYGDETVTIGDTTASVGNLVQATWEAVVERVQLILRVLVEGFKRGTDLIGEFFQSSFSKVSDDVNAVFAVVGTNWGEVTDVMVDVAKAVANNIIGAFKSIGDVIGEIFDRIIEVGGAFTNLNTDITDGFGLGSVADALADAVDPRDFFRDLGNIGTENFNTDFIGEIGSNGKFWYNEIKAEFDAAAENDPLFADFLRLLDPISPREILNRAGALTAAGAGNEGDPAQDIRDALAAAQGLNADIGELNEIDLDPLCNEVDSVTECIDAATQAGIGFGETLATSLGDAVLNAESLEDALQRVFQALIEQQFQSLAVDPAAAGLGSFFGSIFGGGGTPAAAANGAVIGGPGGSFQAFQGGGIFSGPTFFGLPGGGTGLAGEAGPEAILPLDKVGGKLGVRSSDGGGGGRVTNVSQTFNIQTPDADSFRKSRRQIAEDARRDVQGE